MQFIIEYCKTRALPTVKRSEYLNTLGEDLMKDIDIMWTGDKVIPETITKDSIIELSEVIRRKPVIWDNIHANDYDRRRVYLGAYHGRPIELYPHLNGILTNPNCEFEANYIAIHTLGTWCRIARSIQDSSAFDVQMVDLTDVCVTPPETPTSPTEECEMSGDMLLPSLTAADITSIISDYDYKEALNLAIQDWILEFGLNKKAPLKSYAKCNTKTTIVNGQTVLTAVPYALDVSSTQDTLTTMSEDKSKCMALTDSNILMLTEMFCLPYEHGETGNQIQKDFEWLFDNVGDIYEQPPSKEKFSRWFERLLKCDEKTKEVLEFFEKFCTIPNEAILYDLYPYIWELKEVLLALNSYIHWLSDSITSNLSIENVIDSHSAMVLPFNRFPLPSEFIEPWHVKYLGGLTGSLHRLLPFRGGYMFVGRAPDTPSKSIVKMRTYSASDKDALYRYCSSAYSTNDSMEIDFNEEIEMKHDCEIGMYTTISPKTLFLIEDGKDLCGYIAAIPDNRTFSSKFTELWIPEMRKKYDNFSEEHLQYPLTNSVEGWNLPSASHIIINVKEKVLKEHALQRVLNSVLSTLKSSGSTTVYYKLEMEEGLDLFTELGFFPVSEVDKKLLWCSLSP